MSFFDYFKRKPDCPCKDYNDFEIRLKCLKTQLHSRYILCISLGIVVWMLASGDANNPEFSSWISFASTVASIILSVVAIIMSITGEAKTEAIRNQMEDATHRLDEAVKNITLANADINTSIVHLQEKIDSMSEKVDNFSKDSQKSDMTVEKNMQEKIKFD